jgi:membrane dipeptidase
MLIVDAHEDLAWNILTFGRDYTQSAAQIRRAEAGSLAQRENDDTVLGWPEYQRGQVAIVCATLFAVPLRRKAGEWDFVAYADMNQAHKLYQDNLDVYERLVDEHPDKFRLVLKKKDLQEVLADWGKPLAAIEIGSQDQTGHPVGLVISMEGAEGVRAPAELEEWWARGVRFIGPAWAGTRFCGGTNDPGPMTPEGFALLEVMADLGFGLDLSHMDEKAVMQALDVYPGTILASHSNALALLKGTQSNRFLTDPMIRGLLERDGLIGIVPCNMFLKAGWQRGDRRAEVDLKPFLAQIDYICQMAGNAQHVGIGTDFDGGFGLQSIPVGLESIADLQKLAPLLSEKGYSDKDIAGILGENWLTRLRQVLPDSL